MTGGYRLPAKCNTIFKAVYTFFRSLSFDHLHLLLPHRLDIIHSVGPIGENADLFSACYTNALDTLKEHRLRSIAFPAISTGTYGYPKEKAVPVVLKAIRRWLKKPDNLASIDRIILVLFLDVDTSLYTQYLPMYFPR